MAARPQAIWAFLCEARLRGPDAARASLMRVGRDGRPYMRAVYELFEGSGTPQALAEAGRASPGAQFYALLYDGLYAEARGDAGRARAAITAAALTPYGRRSGDYMAGVAEVHCRRRGGALGL